jgi:hypothetical protein
MTNLDALKQAGQAAITAKSELEKRIAENKANWEATSDFVKEYWEILELNPVLLQIHEAEFTCSSEGISNEPRFNDFRTSEILDELQNRVACLLEQTCDAINNTQP